MNSVVTYPVTTSYPISRCMSNPHMRKWEKKFVSAYADSRYPNEVANNMNPPM